MADLPMMGNSNMAGITWPKAEPDPTYVGDYVNWLIRNEPAIVRSYGQALTQGYVGTLEDYVDETEPTLYEIWCIVRYKGDI